MPQRCGFVPGAEHEQTSILTEAAAPDVFVVRPVRRIDLRLQLFERPGAGPRVPEGRRLVQRGEAEASSIRREATAAQFVRVLNCKLLHQIDLSHVEQRCPRVVRPKAKRIAFWPRLWVEAAARDAVLVYSRKLQKLHARRSLGCISTRREELEGKGGNVYDCF